MRLPVLHDSAVTISRHPDLRSQGRSKICRCGGARVFDRVDSRLETGSVGLRAGAEVREPDFAARLSSPAGMFESCDIASYVTPRHRRESIAPCAF